MKNIICPYCHQNTQMVTGAAVYPEYVDLHSKFFSRCKPCGAYDPVLRAGQLLRLLT